jgi:hypothetical protein
MIYRWLMLLVRQWAASHRQRFQGRPMGSEQIFSGVIRRSNSTASAWNALARTVRTR